MFERIAFQYACFSASLCTTLDWWCSTLVVSHWARTSDSCRSHKSRLIHRQCLYTPEWLLHSVKQRASLLMLVSSHETTGWPGNKSSTRRKTYEIDITLTLGVTLTQHDTTPIGPSAQTCNSVHSSSAVHIMSAESMKGSIVGFQKLAKKQPQILLDPSRKRLPSRNHGTDRQTPAPPARGQLRGQLETQDTEGRPLEAFRPWPKIWADRFHVAFSNSDTDMYSLKCCYHCVLYL